MVIALVVPQSQLTSLSPLLNWLESLLMLKKQYALNVEAPMVAPEEEEEDEGEGLGSEPMYNVEQRIPVPVVLPLMNMLHPAWNALEEPMTVIHPETSHLSFKFRSRLIQSVVQLQIQSNPNTTSESSPVLPAFNWDQEHIFIVQIGGHTPSMGGEMFVVTDLGHNTFLGRIGHTGPTENPELEFEEQGTLAEIERESLVTSFFFPCTAPSGEVATVKEQHSTPGQASAVFNVYIYHQNFHPNERVPSPGESQDNVTSALDNPFPEQPLDSHFLAPVDLNNLDLNNPLVAHMQAIILASIQSSLQTGPFLQSSLQTGLFPGPSQPLMGTGPPTTAATSGDDCIHAYLDNRYGDQKHILDDLSEYGGAYQEVLQVRIIGVVIKGLALQYGNSQPSKAVTTLTGARITLHANDVIGWACPRSRSSFGRYRTHVALFTRALTKLVQRSAQSSFTSDESLVYQRLKLMLEEDRVLEKCRQQDVISGAHSEAHYVAAMVWSSGDAVKACDVVDKDTSCQGVTWKAELSRVD
ncbi:hypothetical protein K435DRAFT_797262 [Dendrothele bispora CBS 962.96]|uniref:Uncharacterized protein n=1 Tax=Dendrothele bispora (strain CBS 962.96) TaxID=1314807 RepID=A0A4S8M3E4_DENBC|nr:hypothetical protein K435DRAFT_797262 [Dendrothele bispora CBS 962.96]